MLGAASAPLCFRRNGASVILAEVRAKPEHGAFGDSLRWIPASSGLRPHFGKDDGGPVASASLRRARCTGRHTSARCASRTLVLGLKARCCMKLDIDIRLWFTGRTQTAILGNVESSHGIRTFQLGGLLRSAF